MMMRCAAASIALVLIGLMSHTAYSQSDRSTNAPGATQEQFEQWMAELSNWGRWGQTDQLGAANLITPAKRLQAVALVETGEALSLAHDVTDEAGSDPNRPFGLNMIISFGPDRIRDRLDIDYHGGFFTHLDAICHVVYDGKIYNGHDFRQTVTDDGCEHLGITGLKNGVVTKAVLVDVPRLRGVPYLEPGTRVYREDIEAWEKQTGATVEPGNVLLIRTGRWARRSAEGDVGGTAGMDASFLPFPRRSRCRAVWRRHGARGAQQHSGAGRHGRPQVHRGCARNEPVRQPRSRGSGRDRSTVRTVGISLHGKSRSRTEGHRVTDQPDCGVLAEQRRYTARPAAIPQNGAVANGGLVTKQ